MKVLRNKGEFCTQVYEKPFCTQEPHDFSRWEIQSQPKIDVSNRLRDERGRFLPNDQDRYSFGKQGELLLDLDDVTYEDEPPREIKLVKVDGTYGTYRIEEKMKPSDVLALVCFVIILVIAHFG